MISHRLNLDNLRRLLCVCFSDEAFGRTLALIRRCQVATNDPERFLIWALDSARGLPETLAVGLYLASVFTSQDLDDIAVLVRSVDYKEGTPYWRWGRAAMASLRLRAGGEHAAGARWKSRKISKRARELCQAESEALRLRWYSLHRRLIPRQAEAHRALQQIRKERMEAREEHAD